MQRILKELNTEINRSANLAGTSTNANDLCNAYGNGIKFAIKTITDTSYVTKPCAWIIEFVDGHIAEIKAGDIISVINVLTNMKEPINEIIKCECKPE